jgi:hypothetical protein
MPRQVDNSAAEAAYSSKLLQQGYHIRTTLSRVIVDFALELISLSSRLKDLGLLKITLPSTTVVTQGYHLSSCIMAEDLKMFDLVRDSYHLQGKKKASI